MGRVRGELLMRESDEINDTILITQRNDVQVATTPPIQLVSSQVQIQLYMLQINMGKPQADPNAAHQYTLWHHLYCYIELSTLDIPAMTTLWGCPL